MAKTFAGGLPWSKRRPPALQSETVSPPSITVTVSHDRDCLVAEGDTVRRGELLIAETEAEAAIRCGISGRVASIDRSDNHLSLTITAEASEEEALRLPPPAETLSALSPEAIGALLRERGIALPTPAAEGSAKLLILDAAGDDPMKEGRAHLSLTDPDAVLGGARILMKYFGTRRGVIPVPETLLEVAEALEGRLPRNEKMLHIQQIKDKYPAAEPHLLVSALCRLEIHPLRDPASFGYHTVSATLCAAVYRALVAGIPYTDAYVTLVNERDGEEPRLLTVPFGTRLTDLLQAVGLTLGEEETLLVGGAVLRSPAAKDTVIGPDREAVLIPKRQKKAAKAHANCIGCAACNAACPMNLLPSRLYAYRGSRLARRFSPENCIGCGCCEAVCPAGLPLTETILTMKGGTAP